MRSDLQRKPKESNKRQPEQNRAYTEEELKNIEERTAELKMKGRLLADSAITTYFGRPTFHAYGNANV